MYRGKYTIDKFNEDELAELYSEEIEKILENIKESNKGISCFIHESIQSCAGQIFMPRGYLKKVYEKVKKLGGLCIADEVQVGFGRVGKHWWAFEMSDIVPDIVTLGKPMGNGHPISAVVTKKEISDYFCEHSSPFFSTFGGNPVSCKIAISVLQIIKDEKLRENAAEVGCYFLNRVLKLKSKHSIIGDVRSVNKIELYFIYFKYSIKQRCWIICGY